MQVFVIWESTRGRTKAMAEAVCDGIREAGGNCNLVEARDFQNLDDACAVAVGSSTRMKRPLPKVRQILGEIGGLDGKPVAAFGSYGWSGEAPDEINNLLVDAGGNPVIEKPIKAKDYPGEDALQKCRDLGKSLTDACK
jgi:flavodoxin I